MRYPAPATVATIQGSPRRLRSPETVMRTAFVNGSAFSSQARSSSSSALTTPPSAATRTSSTANCFLRQCDVAVVAVDLPPKRIQPQACDLPDGWPAVSAPAVERPQPEHQLSELERLREVVVGAELEPRGLVVEPVGRGEHEDRGAAAGGDDVLGDLVPGRPGNVSVQHGDVIGVETQQLQSGVAVAGDVRGDRLEAQTVADGLRHVGLVLDDQHAHAPMLEPAPIVGVSKTTYVVATPRCLD